MTTESSQIRIKISNVFGGSNLPITAVTVALPAHNTSGIHQIQASTLQKVTFSGKDSISIPNGALAVSDPLNFPIKAQQVITVTAYLATGQATNSITSHPGSRTTSWWQFGNAVNAAQLTVTDVTTQSAAHWYFLSSVEAWVPKSTGSLLIVGDSITDGRGSDTNKNNRWPDLLLARLQKNAATKHISVGNLAAGGNRILADGLGPNAFGRIDRDVLAHSGIKYAMIFEGVNDIGGAAATIAAQNTVYNSLIQAYKQMATLIRAHGIPVFGATITPFSAPSNFTGQPYSSPVREATRQASFCVGICNVLTEVAGKRSTTSFATLGRSTPLLTSTCFWLIRPFQVNLLPNTIRVITCILGLRDTSMWRTSFPWRSSVSSGMVSVGSFSCLSCREESRTHSSWLCRSNVKQQ